MIPQREYDGLYMRYLGVLKLLESASPYVPKEDRECIVSAMDDACANHRTLETRRVLDRVIIEVKP